MTRAHLWLAIGVLCSLGSVILGPVPAAAFDGNQWLQLPAAARTGYVAGVVDGWEAVDRIVNNPPDYTPSLIEKAIKMAWKCTYGKPYTQTAAIAEKYMRDHPEKWHLQMAGSVFHAVWDSCYPEDAPQSR